jgi:Na+-translocating ferredoxin:NAD+ oxidoreductase subunit G
MMPPGMRLKPSHPAVQLGLFSLIGLGLLALIHAATAERIADNQRAVLRQSLLEVIPQGEFDNDLLADVLILRDTRLGTNAPVTVYRAWRQGQPVANILTAVAPDGYNGAITLLAAIRPDGVLAGVRVLEHHETPGLGDGIETSKSGWVRQFDGRSLLNPAESRWKVRRDGGDFDQFTGATITPRAVVGAVHEALRLFQDRRDELWPMTPAPGATP